MNTLELNSTAEGIFKYLKGRELSPVDCIGIVGIILLMIFDEANDGAITLDQFAEDFKTSLVASHKAKSNEGSGAIQ